MVSLFCFISAGFLWDYKYYFLELLILELLLDNLENILSTKHFLSSKSPIELPSVCNFTFNSRFNSGILENSLKFPKIPKNSFDYMPGFSAYAY